MYRVIIVYSYYGEDTVYDQDLGMPEIHHIIAEHLREAHYKIKLISITPI